MKYYSELTKKTYSTEKECLKDEEAYRVEEAKREEARKKEEKAREERAKKRAERAKEVENAYQESLEARKRYNELLKKFCDDYGSYHMSFSSNLFDNLWDFFL